VGSVPGTNIDLVLATNTEWLFITGRNCSDHQEAGCSNGVYDHRRTESENVDWTLINTVISQLYSFIGFKVTDVLKMRNGVTQIDLHYPFFMIENA